MGNHFDFETAQQLCERLIKAADIMESENLDMQHRFQVLNDTWKDDIYYDYRDKFHDADKTIAQCIECLHDMNKAMLRYAELLRDAL